MPEQIIRQADADTLKAILDRGQVDWRSWASPVTKTAADLLKELDEGETIISVNDSGEVLRVAQPVFINVRYGDLELIEVRQIFVEGKNVGKIKEKGNNFLGEKIIGEEEPLAAAERGLREELHLSIEDKQRLIPKPPVLRRENSKSYPTLNTEYRDNIYTLELTDDEYNDLISKADINGEIRLRDQANGKDVKDIVFQFRQIAEN